MKNKLIIFFAILFLTGTAFAQDKLSGPFLLKIKLKSNPLLNKAYLRYIDTAGVQINDSVQVKDGMATFKGILAEPVLAEVSVTKRRIKPEMDEFLLAINPNNTVGTTSVFLEPSIMQITAKNDSLGTPLIIGGKITNGYVALNKLVEAEYNQMRRLNEQYFNKDSTQLKEKELLLDSIYKIKDQLPNKIYKPFFTANKDSYIGLYALNEYAGRTDVKPLLVEPLLNRVSGLYKSTSLGKRLQNRVKVAYLTAIGKIAPDFSQPDSLGNLQKLSFFKGKYVLLDFWASWCMPCRMESPYLLKAYNKYKDKNFTILSVSIDSDRKRWLEAVYQDNLPWSHVSDLKLPNAAAKSYEVVAIPANYLIDPQGKIIAKGLRHEQLEEKLKTILGY